MKVKYIDKRHWCRLVDREYTEVKVNNDRFKGTIGLVTMEKVRNPLKVTVVRRNIIVADDNYKWLQILPEEKRYSIAVMFDNEGNPLEYYFDIDIKDITQKGNARTVGLCLGVLALPSGEYELVDEDDLMFALESEQITRKQFHEVYVIAHQIMAELENDFRGFQEKIMYCFSRVNARAQKNHQKPQNKANIGKSKQIKPKQYNQTKNHQQQEKN